MPVIVAGLVAVIALQVVADIVEDTRDSDPSTFNDAFLMALVAGGGYLVAKQQGLIK